ncbi:coiled-coil domain-containing protein 121 [Ochotona princeps]|uniref:coiled-coil domain-containing protein 121 n=1 Tax=Ochotona princeps TaxID=9978 RepID=UPI0027152EF6|nr:coiled-coil domain-containing protein 121 [Ochotona princeps]
MGSQGPSPHNPKKRGVRLFLESQKTRTEDARPLPSRTCFAPEEIKQLRAGLARPGTKWDAWSCWAMRRPVEPQTDQLQELSTFTTPNVSARSSAITVRELRGCNKRLDSRSLFPECPQSPPLSYLSLINSLLQPHKRTNVENRIRKRMARVRELDTQIKEARTQQQILLQDTRQLHREKLYFQAENTFFLEYLTHKTEELAKEPTKLWTEYIQESGAVKRRRQRLASKYAKKLSGLKAELLQKRKAQASLKQQLQELKDVSLLKEKQDLQIQKLQEEQSRIEAQSATERHAQFLKEKALLEEQLNEPDARLLDKTQRKERQEKAQALRSAAKRSHLKFCQGVHMENQCLLQECRQLKQQSWKLEARHSRLENQKRQLEQGQWFVQSLLRGRQQLQKRRSGCPQGQGAPQTAPSQGKAHSSSCSS